MSPHAGKNVILLGICPFNVVTKRSDLSTWEDRLNTMLSYFSEISCSASERERSLSHFFSLYLPGSHFLTWEETCPTPDVLVSSNKRKSIFINANSECHQFCSQIKRISCISYMCYRFRLIHLQRTQGGEITQHRDKQAARESAAAYKGLFPCFSELRVSEMEKSHPSPSARFSSCSELQTLEVLFLLTNYRFLRSSEMDS